MQIDEAGQVGTTAIWEINYKKEKLQLCCKRLQLSTQKKQKTYEGFYNSLFYA